MQCYQITDFEAHEEMHLEKVHKKKSYDDDYFYN